MTDYIVIAVLVIVIGSAIFYIIREKKRGTKCIGCPSGGKCGSCNSCGGSCGNGGSCDCDMDDNKTE